MITLQEITEARKYNKSQAGILWYHKKLPLPLRDYQVNSQSFAICVAQNQCGANITCDGKLGPKTLKTLYPAATVQTQTWSHGIDVSRWQGNINWHLVKQDNIEYAIIKCAQGTTQSKNFIENAKSAHATGLTLGYYSWPTPGTNGKWDVDKELKAIHDITHDMPNTHLPFAVDIEANLEELSKEDYTKWIEEYCAGLEEMFSNGVMIYTSKRKVEQMFTDNHKLGKYALWTPRYGSNTGLIQDSTEPSLPTGWDSWQMWQYTSKAQVKGIRGNCDKNIARGEWIGQYLR